VGVVVEDQGIQLIQELNIPEVAVVVLAVQEHQVLVLLVLLLFAINKYLKKL
tara:strand:+ start:548 stop:703 length:156 start_codon:yes stop_codon:yes gene_type:complete